MARDGGVVNYNTFVGGLITEASPLTYPENATLREENFELRRDGTRARRYGMDYETGYASDNTIAKSYIDDAVLMSYEWFNAGSTEGENFLLVQIGQYLHIYNMAESAISSNRLNTTIDLDTYLIDTSPLLRTKQHPISIAALKGILIIASPVIDPVYIAYDPVTGIFNIKKITIHTRDLIGIPDETVSIDHRPTSLSDKHEYNLHNQGWSTANIAKTFTDISVYPSNADIVHLAKQTTYDSTTAGYHVEDIGTYNPTYLEKEVFGSTPAPKGRLIYDVFNRDYKDLSEGTSVDISNITYDSSLEMTIDTVGAHGLVAGDEIQLKDVGIYIKSTTEDDNGSYTHTSRLPDYLNPLLDLYTFVKGVGSTSSFIIHVPFSMLADTTGTWTRYNPYRHGKTLDHFTYGNIIVPSTPALIANATQEQYRVKAVTGYAGRAWYGGIDGGQYSSHIFFSQILDDYSKIGKCYQDADPTSEHISDLIDTDGGYIVIPEARNVQELIPLGQYLFVFSTNGVWRVFGDDGGNFRATGFSIEKVSDVGISSRYSVVSVESEIYYWAKGGIYKIAKEEVSGTFAAINISQLTIQSLFFEIGEEQHHFVKGSYDPAEKKISWLYNRSPIDGDTAFKYNSVLVFDTILNAFYKYLLPLSTDGTPPFIAGLFNTPGIQVLQNVRNLVSGNNNIVASDVNVVDSNYLPRSQVTQTKYLTLSSADTSNYFITFSELNNAGFLDFETFDTVGTDAAAYMITGYDTQGSQAIKKQAHYLIMYFNRTERSISIDSFGNMVADNPSGCLVNILWDWATDINSIRAGSQFQAYRLNRLYIPTGTTDSYTYGEETIVTKSKVRGRGRAVSIAIQSEPGKDLHIYGWSLTISAGQRP